jgi:hypothetical protein
MTDEEVYLLAAQRVALRDALAEAAQPRPIIVAIEGERPPERPLEHRACSPTLH